MLSDPTKRQQWDSVDPDFDDAVPPAKLKVGQDFFAVYGPAFERNARWSKIQPVPALGSLDATKEEVDAFYNFWNGFESWRTFEAYDEEDPEKAESREEKRWIERDSKSARLKKKKEDNARLISLVENAMKLDPRLQKFKDEERKAKEAKKLEREEAVKRAAEEKKRAEEEERLKRQERERQEKLKADQEKKEREARKNRSRKDRKAIRDHAKAADFYLSEDFGGRDMRALEDAVKLDDLLESMEPGQLEAYRARQTDGTQPREVLRRIFEDELERLRGQCFSRSRFLDDLPSAHSYTWNRRFLLQYRAKRRRKSKTTFDQTPKSNVPRRKGPNGHNGLRKKLQCSSTPSNCTPAVQLRVGTRSHRTLTRTVERRTRTRRQRKSGTSDRMSAFE